MEYNKDEACRAMEIARKKFEAMEVAAAKKFAVKALQLYPSLEGLPQMMAVLDVYMAAENKVNSQTDWYAILQVDLLADEALIKKQYRKLALLLHPDKNKCAGAEGAFKLIGEAWGVLSDKIKRSLYDHKRNYVPPPAHRIIQRPSNPNPNPAPPTHNGAFFKYTQQQGRGGATVPGPNAPATFWTACPFCKMQYEYPRNFVAHNLLCPTCQKPFLAFETAFLHRNGHSVAGRGFTGAGAGAAGMSKGRGVPYPSSSSTSIAQNAVPRGSNTSSPSPSTARDKSKNDPPSPPPKNLKKNGSKKENDGRRVVTEKNKRRKKAREETDSDEVIHASSVSEDDDDDEEVAEEVVKDKGNAKKKSRKTDSEDTPRSRIRKKDKREEEEEEEDGPETIDVPDSDFHDFDKDRTPHRFQPDQIWAVYDDDDGMPRFYARIYKVVSSNKFKVKMNWLEALTKEKAVTDWLDAGFYQGCGDFKSTKAVSSDALNIFSHVVVWEKRSKGVIRIIPQKGHVWALYREWSCSWDETTPPQDRHRYEMVEISSDFVDNVGVDVTPLVKVDGFKSVFQETLLVKSIPRSEFMRFSHQVPAKKLLGEESPYLPKDCWELDPAATSEDGGMATA